MDGTGSLNALDWSVIALYFALVFGVAIAAGRRGRGSQRDFFLAGRNVGWFVVGASIFASNIGSEHLVGLAGTAAAPVEEGGGVPVAQFEIMAGLVLLLLAWLFAPFYLRSGVFTMPEFLERRYSAGPRAYLAWLSVVGYVLTKISVTIAAGGIVFETLMGVPFWTGAILIVLITGAYTVWGGLRVVLYTDMVQMFILLGGALCVSAFGLSALGGVEGMRAAVAPEALSLWRGMNHPEFPWTGILFGAPILAVWYWCTDQFIVQRVLSAHRHGGAGAAVDSQYESRGRDALHLSAERAGLHCAAHCRGVSARRAVARGHGLGRFGGAGGGRAAGPFAAAARNERRPAGRRDAVAGAGG